MPQTNRMVPLVLTSINVALMPNDTWVPFNSPAGVDGATSLLHITNDSNTDTFISYDGVHEHEFIRSYKSIDVNFQGNSSPSGDVSKVKNKTVIYAKIKAAFQGQPEYIYLTGYYNELI